MEPMHKINKVEVRNLQIEDYIQLSQSFKRVYADKDVFWTHEQIETLIRIFPEGQVVTVVDDKIVGCALSIIVDYDMVKGDHTYAKVTGNETFCTHNPEGNILYGIEVFIHPDYRGLRLARRMYEYRKELCEKLNLKAIMFGGRIPNYYKYADTMRPKEYLDKVRSREIYDPVLTFQLSNDFHVRRVMKNYLPNDEESKHCATLLQWDNIYYQEPTQDYVDKKTTVRVGLVQWQMRPYKTLDDVFEQVEFFVDAVSDYKSDFVLFPEYFNAPLMAKFNHLGEAQSIRGLAAIYLPTIFPSIVMAVPNVPLYPVLEYPRPFKFHRHTFFAVSLSAVSMIRISSGLVTTCPVVAAVIRAVAFSIAIRRVSDCGGSDWIFCTSESF